MPIIPGLCSACGSGGSSGGEFEHNSVVLCDILPDGTVVAAVILVQEYDEVTGLPVGPPVPTDPATGLPYVVQGTLQACSTGEACGPVTSELLCDNTAPNIYTPYIHTEVWNCDGTLASTSNRDLTGAGYVPVGLPGACPDNAPQFAGLVCDVFGGSPAVPLVPASCPGPNPFTAPANLNVGTGMTETPAGSGVYVPTSAVNASLTWNDASPSDQLNGLCQIAFTLDANFGSAPGGFEFANIQGVDQNGSVFSFDPTVIAQFEGSLGVAPNTPIGTIPNVAVATVSGMTVIMNIEAGSSPNTMLSSNTGNFIGREGDGDGLPTHIVLTFDIPPRAVTLAANTDTDGSVSLSDLLETAATAGTAAIPAQPAGIFQVKQFRNTDGTAFYENLDGTTHTVLGAVGECGEYFSEQLCDATGAAFIRVYRISSGSIVAEQDYDLTGATFAPVLPVGRCSETLATFRHTPIEVLCYTAADGVTVTQFLRRYLIDQDGVNVVAVIDSLLDGVTPFVAVIGGTVAECSAGSATTDCTTASSIGTICYTPPAFVPAVLLTDDWAGVTIVGTSPGPQTFTNSDFGGGTGRVVIASLNKGAGLTGNDILLGIAPTTAGSLYHEHLDLGGMVTGLDITFHSFGTLGSEVLLNLSPAADSVTGSGTLSGGGTVVNPTTSNGTVTVHWNGPLSALDFDWKSTAGGTLSTLSTVSFTTVASGSSTQTAGTAAVLVDCTTGAVTYRDLATGLMLDIDTVTVVDCPSPSATVVTASSQNRLLGAGDTWTPGTDVTGILTGVAFAVISGTATVTDANATVAAGLPTGVTGSWEVDDPDNLTGPASIAAVGGSTYVTWTEK